MNIQRQLILVTILTSSSSSEINQSTTTAIKNEEQYHKVFNLSNIIINNKFYGLKLFDLLKLIYRIIYNYEFINQIE